VFSRVAWPDMVGRGRYKTFLDVSSGISRLVGGWGCYKLVSKLQFSTLSLNGPNELS
jgi:hypothetical protein